MPTIIKTMTTDLDKDALREAGIGSFFRPSQLEQLGITYHRLRQLEEREVVERVGRGLYRLADAEPTERYSIASVCARVPNAIVCLLSALQVHEIGTQLLRQVWIAIPHKTRPPRLGGAGIRLVRFSGAALSYGVQETEFEEVPARITSPARTIVDCFRFERLIGREAALEALQDALRDNKVTTSDLDRVLSALPSRRLSAILEAGVPTSLTHQGKPRAMNGYLMTVDKTDAETAAIIREGHAREFSAVEAALDDILRGLSDYGSRKGKPDNRLESARLFLTTRSFNALRTAAQVLERGYYQQAMVLVRMAMEDQMVALDSESHPATLSALLDDDSKLGRGDLALGKMAERVSAKTKEAWDDDYGMLSRYGAHPRRGSIEELVEVGPDGQIVLRPGSHYDETWVNVVLYYTLRELVHVLATVAKITASAGINWATGAMSTLEEVDTLWRQIDRRAREELGEPLEDHE